MMNEPLPVGRTRDDAGLLATSRIAAAAAFAGLSFLWPVLYLIRKFGAKVLIRGLAGDAYHYLAIARKAQTSHLYTYDGVHVTNGFHPLWQYSIRGLFAMLQLQSHEAQATAVVLLAMVAACVGILLASAAVMRMTNLYFPGMLMAPGLFYLVVGVHVRNWWMWTALEGMESAFSVLFGGVLFFVMSFHIGRAAKRPFDPVSGCRALGLVLPWIVLSRLDDVFLIPGFLLAIYLFETEWTRRIKAGLWIAVPTGLALACYMTYNKLTVGSAMPLSGTTKAGFVAFVSAYLTLGVHFPPIFDLRSTSNPATVFANSFRFVEMVYPLVFGAIATAALWMYRRCDPGTVLLAGVSLGMLVKLTYNFSNVHPWHQADWYYGFIMLSLSVLGALAFERPWRMLRKISLARWAVPGVYAMLAMLSASQYYATTAFDLADTPEAQFWMRKDAVRAEIVKNGVTGLINVDDGVTAFLMDLPMLHGFAFATDVEAQKAFRQGRMLELAEARGINTIVGFDYLKADTPPQTDAEIRSYLNGTLAKESIHGDMDEYTFRLAYFDPVLKLPFFSFTKKGL